MTNLKFDLIVFSSALHHIEDYTSVLKMAADRLDDGGFIYTVFDPLKWRFPAYQIIWLDWLVHAALNYPGDLFSAIKRRLKRAKARQLTALAENGELDLDELTEYHVRSGIDDLVLIGDMEKTGLKLIAHKRYTDARNNLFRFFLTIQGISTGFKILLRK